MPKVLDLRFGVKRSDGYESSVWKVWGEKTGDVYLSMRSMTGIQKFSFHASLICRHAFTKEHGTPATLNDRATLKWTRNPTPPLGSGKAALPAIIFIPSDYLSAPSVHKGKVAWIPAAPAGSGTIVELLYTKETEEDVKTAFATRGELHLLAYGRLNVDEGFAVAWSHVSSDAKDFRMTGRGANDIVISATDPDHTGRPIRVIIGPRLDGPTALLEDYGGYATPAVEP